MELPLPLKISGEILEKDVGVIVLISMLLIVGSYMLSSGSYIGGYVGSMSVIFGMLLAFIFVINQVILKDNFVKNMVFLLPDYELRMKKCPDDSMRDYLVSKYEGLYFIALKENKQELANAFKTKIEELKKMEIINSKYS